MKIPLLLLAASSLLCATDKPNILIICTHDLG
jgi:hypothetical protein